MNLMPMLILDNVGDQLVKENNIQLFGYVW